MQISEVTRFLENAYDVLNVRYFEGMLPEVVITVQSSPRAYGHYTPYDAWKEQEVGYREINIGAERLNRPIEDTIATLIHEMVHHYCAMNGIKDTSRGGTYHNKRFKAECEKRDLVIGYDSKIGHSPTSPSDGLIAFIEEQGWSGIDLSRVSGTGLSVGPSGGNMGGNMGGSSKRSVRKYQCPVCGCSVRATKAVNVGCLDCGTEMELQEN